MITFGLDNGVERERGPQRGKRRDGSAEQSVRLQAAGASFVPAGLAGLSNPYEDAGRVPAYLSVHGGPDGLHGFALVGSLEDRDPTWSLESAL